MVRISLADMLTIMIVLDLDNHRRGEAPGKDLEHGCQRPTHAIALLLWIRTAATTMSQSSRSMSTCVCSREKKRRTRVIKDKSMNAMATAFVWGPPLASRLIPGYVGVVKDMLVFRGCVLCSWSEGKKNIIIPTKSSAILLTA